MPRRSRPRRLSASLVAAAALVLGVTACADTTQLPPAPDTGTETPALFASDEEALAAATAAYEEYAAIVDSALQRDGEIDAVDDVASTNLAEQTRTEVEEFLSLGWTATSQRSISSSSLQSRFVESPEEDEIVIIYVCEDLAGVDVFNADGESVVELDRVDKTSFEVIVEFGTEGQSIVSGREVVNGSGECAP